MSGGGGGLSGLPDDLLRRILYFAPVKEGASTAVLSRRWRSLWRASGAVNLDSRSYPFMTSGDITAALAAAADPSTIRKLTLRVEQHIYEFNLDFGSGSGYGYGYRRNNEPMLATLLRLLHTTAAAADTGGGVEEIRVVIANDHPRRDGFSGNLVQLHFSDLPSGESLRVLHVVNVSTLTAPPAAGVFFPRLDELRLQRCGVSLADLRGIIDAAPQLATLHLQCYYYVQRMSGIGGNDGSEIIGVVAPSFHRIHCPAVTDLVFEACNAIWPWKEGGLELDMPRLQYFRYKGLVHLQNRLSLKLPALSSANLSRTDLHFVRHDYGYQQVQDRFWEFVQSLNVAKVLKLKLDFKTDHLTVDEKDEQLLIKNRLLFYNIERLELEVPCEPATGSKACALFIANLLRCCPVLRDLRLKLTARASRTNQTGLQARSEFDKSIDHFRRHRERPKILSNVDEDEACDEVSDIPGLSGHSFDCLQSYLRTVSLQFWMEEPNCFGVQLAKFFSKNAVVLQEISIDDGNHKLREHVNRMLRRWVGSSKRKNSLTATAFRESHPRKRQRKD